MWHDHTSSQRNKIVTDKSGGWGRGVGKKLKRRSKQHRGIFIKWLRLLIPCPLQNRFQAALAQVSENRRYDENMTAYEKH